MKFILRNSIVPCQQLVASPIGVFLVQRCLVAVGIVSLSIMLCRYDHSPVYVTGYDTRACTTFSICCDFWLSLAVCGSLSRDHDVTRIKDGGNHLNGEHFSLITCFM